LPWSVRRYPPAMEALPERVRLEAIRSANTLLEEGMEEGRAIRIAVAKAKNWAARRRPELG